jgi:hypothetical protein
MVVDEGRQLIASLITDSPKNGKKRMLRKMLDDFFPKNKVLQGCCKGQI